MSRGLSRSAVKPLKDLCGQLTTTCPGNVNSCKDSSPFHTTLSEVNSTSLVNQKVDLWDLERLLFTQISSPLLSKFQPKPVIRHLQNSESPGGETPLSFLDKEQFQCDHQSSRSLRKLWAQRAQTRGGEWRSVHGKRWSKVWMYVTWVSCHLTSVFPFPHPLISYFLLNFILL